MALTKKESTREGSRMKAQDQKELMRERICDCAKRLFEREGYEQVSMRQIAAEAGIAVGNLTYYFSKKEDLLKERLNDIQETFQRASSCLKSIWKEERFQESRSGNMRIEHFWNCCFDF